MKEILKWKRNRWYLISASLHHFMLKRIAVERKLLELLISCPMLVFVIVIIMYFNIMVKNSDSDHQSDYSFTSMLCSVNQDHRIYLCSVADRSEYNWQVQLEFWNTQCKTRLASSPFLFTGGLFKLPLCLNWFKEYFHSIYGEKGNHYAHFF